MGNFVKSKLLRSLGLKKNFALTLILVEGGIVYILPCWFSPAFCHIQQHFIRNIQAKFGITNLSQSNKTQMGVFPISGFLVKPL